MVDVFLELLFNKCQLYFLQLNIGIIYINIKLLGKVEKADHCCFMVINGQGITKTKKKIVKKCESNFITCQLVLLLFLLPGITKTRL